MKCGDIVYIYNLYSQFEEIALIIADTLTKYGLTVLRTKTVNWDNNHWYILFGVNVWEDFIPFPKKFVIVQLEQFPIKKWFNAKYLSRLACASQVWDYNLENTEFLQARGINTIHVPIGYIPSFDPITPITDYETCDVLFLGQLNNPYRQNVLSQLRQAGIKIQAFDNLYGDEKKKMVVNSKIVLNIHYGKYALFEEARVIPLLSCSRIVISETVNDKRYLEKYRDVVDFVSSVEEMIERCLYWLSAPLTERQMRKVAARKWALENTAYKLFPAEVLE